MPTAPDDIRLHALGVLPAELKDQYAKSSASASMHIMDLQDRCQFLEAENSRKNSTIWIMLSCVIISTSLILYLIAYKGY